jgi:hypothetical protein
MSRSRSSRPRNRAKSAAGTILAERARLRSLTPALLLLAWIGCANQTTTSPDDASVGDASGDGSLAVTCPSGVTENTLYYPGQSGNVACAPVGVTCLAPGHIAPVSCYCTCAGYWNCDDVLFFCDGGVHD